MSSLLRRPAAGEQPRSVTLTELLGRRVQEETGRSLGHVIDVLLRHEGGRFTVEALELGQYGLFDRLHVTRPLAHRARGAQHEPRLVPWERVTELGPRRIVVTGAEQDGEPD